MSMKLRIKVIILIVLMVSGLLLFISILYSLDGKPVGPLVKFEEIMKLRCYQIEMGAVYVATGIVDSVGEGSHQWVKGVEIEVGEKCPVDLGAIHD